MVSLTKSKSLPMLIDMWVKKKRVRVSHNVKNEISDGLVWVVNRVTEKLEWKDSFRFVFLTAKTEFSQTHLNTFAGSLFTY